MNVPRSSGIKGRNGLDIDQYFKTRADLTVRALSEGPAPDLLAPDWRFYGAGLLCVATATISVLTAAVTQSDAGYFARMTTFLGLVLLAGLWLLTIAQAAHVFLARDAVISRDAVREKTLAQLLRIDSALAHKALQRLP